MRYNEIVTQRDCFIQHCFSNVKTQQSPCCFHICQSDLQAGIIKSVLQWQRRESFKGAYYSLIFIIGRKFGCKDKKIKGNNCSLPRFF